MPERFFGGTNKRFFCGITVKPTFWKLYFLECTDVILKPSKDKQERLDLSKTVWYHNNRPAWKNTAVSICNWLYSSHFEIAEMCGHFVISINTIICQIVPNCAPADTLERWRGACAYTFARKKTTLWTIHIVNTFMQNYYFFLT